MNVTDMNLTEEEIKEVKSNFKLKLIFEKQKKLMEKYDPIEKNNGLILTDKVPVDIHNRFGQQRLKDFAWRITEEISEATEACEKNIDSIIHFQEELIDSLHFMVELCILSDVNPDTLYRQIYMEEPSKSFDALSRLDSTFIHRETNLSISLTRVKRLSYLVIESLGKAMNCLKNKPWKQSNMLTDVVRYKENLSRSFENLIVLLRYSGLNSGGIYAMYCLKNKVNLFRQESKY